MNAPVDIAVLKGLWLSHKAAENAAKDARLEVEKAILAFFPTDKLEGTETDKEAGISVTFKVTRKVDTDALQTDWDKLNTNAKKAFKWSADVDTKQFRALADLDPTTHSTISAYITTTPAKPAITIKD